MKKIKTIISLTSIRGFAALFVVWYHVAMSFTKQDFLFFRLFKHGDLSVDLFFVLSGFILHHVYRDKNVFHNYKFFIYSRLARIYPLHLITLVTLLIIVLLLGDFSNRYNVDFTIQSFLMNLMLIQNWGFIPPSWNMVSWSISAEWFMYLLFPFMVYGVNYFKINKYPLVYLLCILLIFVVYYSMIHYFKLDGYGGLSLGGMIRVFFEFSLGFCLYGLRSILLNYQVVEKSSFLTGFLCLVLFSTLIWNTLYYLFLPIAALLLLNLSVANNRISHLFEKKICVWLGEISYSLYMWHWIIIQLINYLIFKNIITVHGSVGMLMYFFTVTIISLLIAHYSHKYIEVMGQNKLKGLMIKT